MPLRVGGEIIACESVNGDPVMAITNVRLSKAVIQITVGRTIGG
jgi:hypothetical protein